MGFYIMTLLERLEAALPWAREMSTMADGRVVPTRFAYFEPLSLSDVEEIIAALKK